MVIELASTSGAGPSDQGLRGVYASRRMMSAYIANGAWLGWLLFPEQRAVEIRRDGDGVIISFLITPKPPQPSTLALGRVCNSRPHWQFER